MLYVYDFSDDFRDTIARIKKKDKLLSERIDKKILEIIENPFHYKPLRYALKGVCCLPKGHYFMITSNFKFENL